MQQRYTVGLRGPKRDIRQWTAGVVFAGQLCNVQARASNATDALNDLAALLRNLADEAEAAAGDPIESEGDSNG